MVGINSAAVRGSTLVLQQRSARVSASVANPVGALSSAKHATLALKEAESVRTNTWIANQDDALRDNVNRALEGVAQIKVSVLALQELASAVETGQYNVGQMANLNTMYTNTQDQITAVLDNVRNGLGNDILNNVAMPDVEFGSDADQVTVLPTIDLRLATLTIAADITSVANATTSLAQLDVALGLVSVATAQLKDFEGALTAKSEELKGEAADINDVINSLKSLDYASVADTLAELSRGLQMLNAIEAQNARKADGSAQNAARIVSG